MPFCPTCRTEYRPDVHRCVHCEQALVAELPDADEAKSERLREAVNQEKAALLARASYSECCQMVEMLHSNGVDAMLTGDPASCGKTGNCSVFFVAVLPEDFQAAAQVMKAEWKKLVDSDQDFQRANPDAAVDFDSEGQKVCPASGCSFEGTPQECPECGLFLGVETR